MIHQAGDRAAAESERRLHRLLRAAGLTGWITNYPVRDESAVIAEVDVAFPAAMVAVEIDGWAYHSDVARFRGDRHR